MIKSMDIRSILNEFKACQIPDISRTIEFWNAYRGEKISYLGFNFEDGKVNSIKYYLTIFTPVFPMELFPISSLREDFAIDFNLYDIKYGNSKYSNGGGITFVVKFNLIDYFFEVGYYFRSLKRVDIDKIDLGSFHTSSQEFKESYGCYKLIDETLSISSHLYGYLAPNVEIKRSLPKIQNWDAVRGIEVAKIDNIRLGKLILLGGEELFENSIFSSIPTEVVNFRNENKLNFVCPAFKLNGSLCSVYLTDFSNDTKVYI